MRLADCPQAATAGAKSSLFLMDEASPHTLANITVHVMHI